MKTSREKKKGNSMKKLLILFPFIFAVGCSTVSSEQRPQDYFSSEAPVSQRNGGSLFAGDSKVLSDQDIARILNYRLKLPRQNRIAVLRLSSNNYWRFYSNDFVQLNDDIAGNFVKVLKQSNRVYDVSYLPSLLIPEKRTVPYLRAAAARYQADLMLAYRSRCHSFNKYRFLSPDKTRAYCTVEAVLVDVRTGIVPFTAISMQEVSDIKKSEELSLNETIEKARLKAIGNGLGDIAGRLVKFLKTVKTG